MSKDTQRPVSRRDKITQANSVVFTTVCIGSVVVMFSIISMRFLWNQKKYNDRVIVAKTEARDAINTNLSNLDNLSGQFPTLEQSATTNSKTILHALPPVYDYAGLATSIESLTRNAGVSFTGGVGEDISASATTSAVTSTPIEIPITLTVEGSFESTKKFVDYLERSIRPFHVSSVDYSGSAGKITLAITAVTYYQPVRTIGVTKEEMQ